MADKPRVFSESEIIEFKKTFSSMAAAVPDNTLSHITKIMPEGTPAWFVLDAIQTWPHDPFVKDLIEKHQDSVPKKQRLIAELVAITKDPFVEMKYKLVAYKLILEALGYMPSGTAGPGGGSSALKKDDRLAELAAAIREPFIEGELSGQISSQG